MFNNELENVLDQLIINQNLITILYKKIWKSKMIF